MTVRAVFFLHPWEDVQARAVPLRGTPAPKRVRAADWDPNAPRITSEAACVKLSSEISFKSATV